MPVVIEHDGKQNTYQLQATTDNAVGLKMLNLDPRDHPEVMEVMSGSAAEKAGLKQGDHIISLAGVPIASREQLIDIIHKRGGQPTEMRVERGAQKVALNITPMVDPTTKSGRIGVALGVSSTQVYIVQKPGPTPWEQVRNEAGQDILNHRRAHSYARNGRGRKRFGRAGRHPRHPRQCGE